MYRHAGTIAMACMCCAIPALAAAQGDVRPNEWGRGTMLNGSIGVTADSSQSAPALGGAIGWELTPKVALEGAGTWTDFGQDTTAFSGALKVRLRVAGHRHIDSFLQAGIGLHRRTIGRDDVEIPDFYLRRMQPSAPGQPVSRTFTDPTAVGGGGVAFFLNRHLALVPDVEVAFAIRDGHSHVVTTAAFHVVYHIENHPVTPARRR